MSKFAANVNNQLLARYESNILDRYDLSTYNLCFFFLPESEMKSSNPDFKKRIIIAQTGVDAGFYIDDLEFTSIIAPSYHTRTTLSSNYKFRIVEPNGMSLLDKIFISSSSVGIKNYMQIPYYIEISFKARNRTTSEPVDSSDAELGDLRWIEEISIAKVETNVSIYGTEYQFSAAPYSNISNTSQVSNIPDIITITSQTFGESIDLLAEVLNSRETNKLLTEHSKQDEYIFDIAPEFRSMKLVDEGNINSQSDRTSNPNGTINNSTRTFTIAKETPIAKLIDDLLSSCPQYQSDAKNSRAPEEYKANSNDEMKTIHRIITTCQVLDYDETRNDYQKKYTYAVVPYRVGTAVLDPAELQLSSKEKIDQYKQQYLLVKNYNWLYTGQNDQVLNFDCKFRFSWHIPLPRHGAIKSTTEQISGQFSASVGTFGLTDEVSKKTQKSKTDALKSSVSANNAPVIKYISDVEMNDSFVATSPGIGRNIPLSWISADHSNVSNTIEGPANQGREYVNILFDQLFVDFGAPNLAVIDIEIKGDPYWLGEPYNYKGKSFRSISSSVAENKPSDAGFLKFNYSQIFFMLNIGVPAEYSTDTGIINNISRSLYSGVYNAVRVTNKMSAGKFTQQLYAIKHPLIDSRDIDE